MTTPKNLKKGWRLLDHRGAMHSCVDISTLSADPRFADPVFRLMLARAEGLRFALPMGAWVTQFIVFILVEVPIVVLAIVLAKASGVGPISMIIGIACGILTCYLVLRALNRSDKAASQLESLGALLAEGVCAGCGYNLAGLKPEADGCRVCPECGAAWHDRAIRREHSFVDRVAQDEFVSLGTSIFGSVVTPDRLLRGKRGNRLHGQVKRRDARSVLRAMLKTDLSWAKQLPVNDDRGARLITCRAALRSAAAGYCIALTIAVAAVVVLLIVFVAGTTTRGWPLLGVLGLAACCFVWSLWSSRPVPLYRLFRRIVLENQVCPGCGWDLRKALPAADGCTVCPECEAAWKLTADRVVILEKATADAVP